MNDKKLTEISNNYIGIFPHSFMSIFIHMTDYSIPILEDRYAVYSIDQLPLISIVSRRY